MEKVSRGDKREKKEGGEKSKKGEREEEEGESQCDEDRRLMEHDTAGGALQAMRRITGDYRAGREQAATLYRALEELEADLWEHIHKENEILFPRVIAMESGATDRLWPR